MAPSSRNEKSKRTRLQKIEIQIPYNDLLRTMYLKVFSVNLNRRHDLCDPTQLQPERISRMESFMQTVCNWLLFYFNLILFNNSLGKVKLYICLSLAQQPPVGQGLLIHEDSRSHTTTHHSQQNSSGRVISPSQRPLPDNTQHSRQTSMPPVGFEPTISTGDLPQTYALDRMATATGKVKLYTISKYKLVKFKFGV